MALSANRPHQITRHFLGWDAPLLPRAVDWLVAHGASPSNPHPFWFSDIVCVLPGQRAARRFLELLVLRAEETGMAVVPPHCVGVGSLPEFLAGSSSQVLSLQEQQGMWREVLSESRDLSSLESLSESDVASKAVELTQLWNLLGRAGYTFRNAQERIRQELDLLEDVRWDLLAHLEERYREKLETNQLADRSLHREGLLASDGWRDDGKRVVLIGAVDLGGIQCQFLERTELELDILLPFPESHHAGVDSFGVLVPEYWRALHRERGVDSVHLTVAADLESESTFVVKSLSESVSHQNRSLQEFSVALGDETTEEVLVQSFSAAGISYHSYGEVGELYRLFAFWCRHMALFLERGTFDTFIALLETTWSARSLRAHWPEGLFPRMRQYGEERCFFQIFSADPSQLPSFPDDQEERISSFRTLFRDFQKTLSLSDLAKQLFLLFSPQGETTPPALSKQEHEVVIESVEDLLRQFESTRERASFHLTGTPFFRLLAEAAERVGAGEGREESFGEDLSRGQVKTGEAPVGVEVLGWLETLFDDAPHLFILGFHDGSIPGSVREDRLLPGRLRTLLALEDEEKRFARDYLYVLHAVSSREQCQIVFPKSGMGGDFLSPSRLLLGGARELFLENTKKCFHTVPYRSRMKLFPSSFGRGNSWRFGVEMAEIEPPRSPLTLSVTSFKDYLRCPFRYYLRHILKKRADDVSSEELSPSFFGSLFHEVVAGLAQAPEKIRHSVRSEEIAAFLLKRLARLQNQDIGGETKPAVEVQLRNLEERLERFADVEAEWRREGWEIAHGELPIKSDVVFLSAEGERIALSGRIDRVDYHRGEQRWMALDYKTSARVVSPEKAHAAPDGSHNGWSDLQLPLYRYALQEMGFVGEISVGYVQAPPLLEATAFSVAEWGEEEFSSALSLAQWCAQQIQLGNFWPPTSSSSLSYDEFSELLAHFDRESSLSEIGMEEFNG
ncbi:PD-(D/E)XK nuclease family protein [bacterium]|nr:PD-(D/E)XK nuclease family protein [bacterium]